MILFTLPWPPSLNTYWRNVGGKVLLSAAAREYRREVGYAVIDSAHRHREALAGRLSVKIECAAPDARRYDIDNRAKGLLDALQHCGVYLDDWQIDDLRIVRLPISRPRGFARVEIHEIPQAKAA